MPLALSVLFLFGPVLLLGLADMAALHLWQLGWVFHFPFARLYPIIASTSCDVRATRPHLWHISNVWIGAFPDRLRVRAAVLIVDICNAITVYIK